MKPLAAYGSGDIQVPVSRRRIFPAPRVPMSPRRIDASLRASRIESDRVWPTAH